MKTEKYGIKETSEVFDAINALVVAGKEAKQNDGKIDLNDAGLVLPALIKMPTAINGIGMVPKELGDLSEAEIEQLRDKLGDALNDPDYMRAFVGLANGFSAIQDIIEKGKADEAEELLRSAVIESAKR